MKTIKNIELAKKIAIRGRNKKQYHLGCVAKRKDGSIVSSFNTRSYGKAPSSHAEAKTLRKAGLGATIWVSRVMANNSLGMAKPCETCQKLIRKYKVKKVYYSISDDEYGVWIP